MPSAAVLIKGFGVGSLALASANYTLDKRNAARFKKARNFLRRF